jgi:hypothetical protein
VTQKSKKTPNTCASGALRTVSAPEKSAVLVRRKAAADPIGWKKHKAEIVRRSRERKQGTERTEWLARHNENQKLAYRKRVATDPSYLERKRESGKRWRDANRELSNDIARKATARWRAANPEKVREQNSRDKEKKRIQQLAKRREMRQSLLDFFGGKCVRCGISDPRALHIDHVNGDGNKERKIGKGSKRDQYALVQSDPESARTKYQLLCANCNTVKQVERGEYRKS